MELLGFCFDLFPHLFFYFALSVLERCRRHVITNVVKPPYSAPAWRLRQLHRLMEHKKKKKKNLCDTPLNRHIFQRDKSNARMLRYVINTFKYVTMTRKPPKDPLLVVLGATGTGKSQVRSSLLSSAQSNNFNSLLSTWPRNLMARSSTAMRCRCTMGYP
jgi:hypothetical protein